MEFLALPRAKEARGTVTAPPSKSATNRALLLAALSPRPVLLARPLESGDTRALCRCLAAMGARIEATSEGLRVSGPLGASLSAETALDSGDSGTAARFLAAAASVTPGCFLLDGSPRLRERPMAELVAALRSAGASITCPGEEGFLPLAIRGGSLRACEIAIDASRSSQFLSALLLAGVCAENGWTIRPSGAVASAPYVEETLEVLRAFGHAARREAGAIAVARGSIGPARYEVPGDFSSALALLACAGACGGRVVVLGLPAASAAADTLAFPVLERMGLTLERGPDRVTAEFAGRLRAVRVTATEFPDAVPVLAALAGLAEGESHFEGIGHLRWKESDRIAALEALLRAAGGTARSGDAELVVPAGVTAGRTSSLPTFGDHRLAMAASLLAIARGGYLVEDPACVAKSYPGYFHDLESLIRV